MERKNNPNKQEVVKLTLSMTDTGSTILMDAEINHRCTSIEDALDLIENYLQHEKNKRRKVEDA